MSKTDIVNNLNELLISNFSENQIFRCEKCSHIPLIHLKIIENAFYIEYQCPNNHTNNVLISNFFNQKKEKKNLNKSFYNFDSTCDKHYNKYIYFNEKLNKNYCKKCETNDLEKKKCIQGINDKFKNYIKEIINNEEKIFNDLKSNYSKFLENFSLFINNLNIVFNKYLDKIYSKINFMKNIYNTYYFKEKLNDLNFQIIQNFKNLRFLYRKNNFIKKFNMFSEKIGKYYDNIIKDINNDFKSFRESNLINCLILKKIINTDYKFVTSLVKIKNGNFLESTSEKITVYNKNNLQPIYQKTEKNCILNLFLLNNHNLVSIESNSIINLYQINTENYEFNLIQEIECIDNYIKGIELSNNELCFLGKNKISFFKLSEKENYICNNKIDFNIEYDDIIYYNNLEHQQIILSSFEGEHILFFDLKENKTEKIIDNIKSSKYNNILLIFDNILIVGGINYIYSINLLNLKIINNKSIKNSVCSLIFFFNKENYTNNIITGDIFGNLIQYNLIKNDENFELKEISHLYNIHNDVIKYILNIDNEHIITAGDELKIWE